VSADASALVVAGFVVLPLFVAVGFVAACEWAGRRLGHDATLRRRRAAAVAGAVLAWLAITHVVAANGALRCFDATPPPFAVMVVAIVAIGVAVPLSGLGTLLVRGLPLWALVGSQAFRLPLELVMHQAAVEGVMPSQMSYSGWNFDIVTGVTAGVLALWLRRRETPRALVACWNVLGFLLLVNVVTIAIVSTPLFGWFGPDRLNVFVTYPPFIWLPTVLVVAALMGHVLVARRLAGSGLAFLPFARAARTRKK
jgi:hypothetical protein